jgi:hypothetical protein
VDEAFAELTRGQVLAVSWVNLRGPEFAIRK